MQSKFELFHTRFKEYVATFTEQDGSFAFPVLRKREHTDEVCLITDTISMRSGIPPHDAFLFRVCALFHDLSRFEQYRKFKTFRDADSFDHGDRSAELMLENGFVKELSPEETAIVAAAIRAHNKMRIPPDIAPDALPAAKMVRDADKLSILNLIWEFFTNPVKSDPTMRLELPNTPGYSPEILQCVLDGRPVRYGDMRSVNDFIIMLFGWVPDLNFPMSKAYAAEHLLYDHLFDLVPKDERTELLPALTKQRLGVPEK